jgi:eukaryotic-like serine/threonine-protein kinase
MAITTHPQPARPAAVAAASGFDRFALQRVLGEGAQAIVWLALDQRLEREVAVKLMRAPPGADPVAVGEWLREARSVSRLNHPHIVQLYDADLHRQQPYLVFEYVAGPTLAAQLKARGALPANEAVALMIDVLDALQAAHAAGVVHRDLKPSNVLIGAGGRARVMDFGIAARLHDALDRERVVGTPGYMSPEATQGGMPTAAMDVFSAGVMLVEALCGHRLVTQRDPQLAMQQVATQDLQLPDSLAAEVDDALRATLRRALQRSPAQRWASAGEFRDALAAWLAPPKAEPAAAPDAAGRPTGGALDFLLRRMRHNSDFPALSDAVARIQRVANAENGNLESLSSEILKDVALTGKLLRLVNTARFRGAGGSIGTVSRAVALVGFNGIRNLALSLVLLEHMHDKAHASQLQEEFLRSLLAGMLASELGSMVRDSEQAFIGAMFQNLGRQLTEFYFPQEARQVRALVAASGTAGALPLGEDAASASVLGLSYESLGLGVAKVWGLPPALQACMSKPAGDAPARELHDAGERVRWLAHAANQVSELLLHAPPEEAPARIAALARRYARALGVPAARFEAAADIARQRLTEMAESMHMHVAAHAPARRLLARADEGTAVPAADEGVDLLLTHTLQATQQLPRPDERGGTEDAAAMLVAGIQDITNTMVEDFKLNDVLRMVLETMFRALGFRRVVFCLRDARTQVLTGRFGLGEDAAAVAALFKVPLARQGDLFSAVCLKGADTLVADATQPRMAASLPAWYRDGVAAPAFLLLPMLLQGKPMALIYADMAKSGSLELGDKELALLRTLRNQALMAFKQAG